ncbi:hypothetical protein [Clostridium sp.]|uniref:hypothetical protein n=1 Tax=Clostridium sp. TaxID=1506 RepID=UPI001DAF5855|nr:hypothetical protein [Clostridium sp.]MBS5985997.1 hypothetical protein [Clostridium sp.]
MKYIKTSIPFILCLLTLPVYIYLYKYSLNGFWILFVLERVLTPFLGKKIENLLDEDLDENLNEEEAISAGKFTIFLIIFCLATISIFIYILFKYPRLFILIMIGECIDKVLEKIICNIRENRKKRGF